MFYQLWQIRKMVCQLEMLNKLNYVPIHRHNLMKLNWMVTLGLAPKKMSVGQELPLKRQGSGHDATNEEAKQLAAAALSAVKDCSLGKGRGAAKSTTSMVQQCFAANVPRVGISSIKVRGPTVMIA